MHATDDHDSYGRSPDDIRAALDARHGVAPGRHPVPDAWLAADAAGADAAPTQVPAGHSMSVPLADLNPRQRLDAAGIYYLMAQCFPVLSPAARSLMAEGDRFAGIVVEVAPMATETRLRRTWQRLRRTWQRLTRAAAVRPGLRFRIGEGAMPG